MPIPAFIPAIMPTATPAPIGNPQRQQIGAPTRHEQTIKFALIILQVN
jgi:hypothetical protein